MDSPIVREQLEKIEALQKDIFLQVTKETDHTYEERVEHLEKLEELLEAQQSMYLRMSLSDDPDAEDRTESIKEFISMMGWGGSDVNAVFTEMREELKILRDQLLDE